MAREEPKQVHVSIDPQTRMGRVGLVVSDLARSLDYYQNGIGLRLLRRENGTATLGTAQRELLYLVEQPGAKPVGRGRTGLYHYALLMPSRPALGDELIHLIQSQTPIGGASDHGVSEALYLSDPDGHGIEIYRDRPRSEWPRTASGELAMVTDPLDAEGVMAAAAGTRENEMDPGTVMGHVHLHVASVGDAEAFYVDTLGFDQIQRFGPQASFISAGGYHHHLGLNIWAGAGAPPPEPDAARLLWFECVLPTQAALDDVLERLAQRNLPVVEQDHGWLVRDPSQNGVVLCTAHDAVTG